MEDQENPELAHFREQWKAEVRARAAPSLTPTTTDTPTPAPVLRPTELYRRAVRAEENGELDEALRLYRQAFRKDPMVDKAFHKEELALNTSIPVNESGHQKSPIKEDSLALNMQHLTIEPISNERPNLDSILNLFPGELVFISQDEQTLSPLQVLPIEVLVYVLMQFARHHDVSTIERFASVSRKARAISLDAEIWRYLVQRTYIPPQIPRRSILDEVTRRYDSDYRRMYIEFPRLRLDGVYIAVCHYVRAGLSENAWVTLTHLITYHRYLRFLPSGQVLSLLANEDTNPQEVVKILTPGLRMKGFLSGNWHLDGTTVHVTDLMDPYSPAGKYSFQMVLHLKSRPTGRWNKLDLAGYESVETTTREAVPFPLKHERPFWFSKVKSYQTP